MVYDEDKEELKDGKKRFNMVAKDEERDKNEDSDTIRS